MAKIFSGDASKPFWDAVNASHHRNTLYDYGLKAQELEAENADLRESLRWLVISETTRFDECQAILEPGSKGGYSPEMLKAMELVEDK